VEALSQKIYSIDSEKRQKLVELELTDETALAAFNSLCFIARKLENEPPKLVSLMVYDREEYLGESLSNEDYHIQHDVDTVSLLNFTCEYGIDHVEELLNYINPGIPINNETAEKVTTSLKTVAAKTLELLLQL
jgi:hypothetical protein